MEASAYFQQLLALMPRGRLFSYDGSLGATLMAIAEELSLVDQRSEEALMESDSRTATETLSEREDLYELSGEGTDEERRARIISRELRISRVRPVDYQQKLAAVLGLDPEDVVVIETGSAQAAAMGDTKEIYRFFIYRNPALAGEYTWGDAQAELDRSSHSHTKGHVIESVEFLCDDEFSRCDRDILGVSAG